MTIDDLDPRSAVVLLEELNKVCLSVHLRGQCSFSNDAILTTNYSDDYMVRGNGFLLQKTFSIAALASLLILIDYTTYTGDNKRIFVRPAIFSSTYGVVKATIYRGTNYVGGTALHAYNLNTIIGGESKTTFTSGPTGSVKGTPVQEWIIGTGSTNQSSGGGSIAVGVNIMRGNNSKTLMEIVNESGKVIDFNIVQELYEI